MPPDTASRLVIPLLSAANFVIGMGAFMVIGALAPVAEDLGIDPATAGRLMIFYAIGYALLSPLLVALTGRIGRRRVLALGMAIFALANLIAALAPGPDTLFASRVLAAAGAGLLTPVAAGVAATLSAPERRASALSAVFFGLTLSQVAGVPAGGFIAYTFGWRAAFALVALLSLPFVALIWFRVPAGLRVPPVSLGDLGRTLVSPRLLIALLFTCVFTGATYVVFTYISPLLGTRMGFGRDGITAYLLACGFGAVAGNLLGGWLCDRIGPARTLGLLTLVQATLLPWFSYLPLPAALLFFLGFAWSAFGWSFNAPQQMRLITLDPGRASVLLALNAAGIYIGSALGSWAGGAILAARGLDALGLAACLGAIAALGVLILGEWASRRPA
ncbi:MFS transporter [Seohaeicola nanhaiensis]|uniref:MFS transporter n=1 Tax=Seohaeicola nanhaiensis TaxID=1387282 RepID=A0ABV9KG14_9RHOB